MGWKRASGLMLVAGLLSSCAPGTILREAIRPSSPHDKYAESLRESTLDDTALGQAWLAASDEALRQPTAVDLPFRETGYMAAAEPAAAAWRFDLQRGRRLVVSVETIGTELPRVFLDLFELEGEPAAPNPVSNAPDVVAGQQLRLEFEIERDGSYILRLQPELLRSGRFTLTAETSATLTFPVEGRDGRSLATSFGDPRDAGRREHQGIDLFAPRGTTVVAAADGTVSSVGLNNLGGNVVWINAARGLNHYYAHLDEQLVSDGARVSAGDPIGTVGNTGNARSTAAHLHFGIYSRGSGAIDPFPFLYVANTSPPPITVDLEMLGTSRRVSGSSIRLRTSPRPTADVRRELPRHTVVHVTGGMRDWYRVRLPDGTSGFVSGQLTESLGTPVQTRTVADIALLDRPFAGAAPIAALMPRVRLDILGRFGAFSYVRTPDGTVGWIPT
jgi:murein DD-endopeptidase MepM/ murein hydrolase activator NlpD